MMIDLETELLIALRSRRAVMLAKLDGLSNYDQRRPLTPSGTNLLGLVKHLGGWSTAILAMHLDGPHMPTVQAVAGLFADR